MNLQPLFETQKKLDERIVKEKGLEGVALLDKKILALQVELGELANEFRGFKFWSENQEPRTYGFDDDKDCEYCNGTGVVREHPSDTGYGCPDCEGSGFMHYNPLLEEYVDCLHFILSIGNDVMAPKVFCEGDLVAEFEETTELQFLKFNKYLHSKFNRVSWINVMNLLLGLGEMLGFTWEQIEQAYYDKNKVNHERQANGY